MKRRWALALLLPLALTVRAHRSVRPAEGRRASIAPGPADYVRLLERFPRYAERGWHDGYRGNPALGYFGDGRSDENGQRTLANFIMSYAFLATRPGYDPGVSGVAASVLAQQALAAVRYALHTHVTGDLPCTDGRRWGDHWQSAWWTSRLVCGADLLWNHLTDDDKAGIKRVVAHEADRHLGLKPRDNEYLDTKAEENAWDSEVLAWALNLYPGSPHARSWREAFDQLALNTFSLERDLSDAQIIDGKPMNQWIGGPCVHPDFTIENHGFFHIGYMACPLHSLAWDYYVFRRFHRKPPSVLYHHTREVWNRLKEFFLWRGRFAYAGGKDWPRYAYGLYFIMPALVWVEQAFDDPDARLIEGLRFATFGYEQSLDHDGSFFSGRFTHLQMNRWPAEWETDAAACLTMAALLHRFAEPIAPSSIRGLSRRVAGTFISPYSQIAICRSSERFVSWGWKTHSGPVTGAICSDRGEDMLEWDHSLCGAIDLPGVRRAVTVAVHHEEALPNGFTSTGIVRHGSPDAVNERLSWSALPDGRTAVLITEFIAAAPVTAKAVDLLDWRIANDIFNGRRRTVFTGDPHHRQLTLLGLDGPGRQTPLNSRWLNIDGDLGVALASSGAHFVVQDIPKRLAPQRSLCFARVQLVPDHLSARFAAGETIARAVLVFRTRVSAASTRRLAWQVAAGGTHEKGAGTVITVAGTDGRRYRVSAVFGPAAGSAGAPTAAPAEARPVPGTGVTVGRP